MLVRRLGPDDQPALEAFLRAHADSSLFLRSNLRVAGVVDHGEPHQATYVGAFARDLLAVAAHCWNGNLLLQAPRHLDLVVPAVIAESGRDVTGILGPWDQVRAARAAVASVRRPRLESHDGLFALDLERVTPPVMLGSEVRCRATRAQDLDLVVGWRVVYEIELLGAVASPEHRTRVRDDVERQHATGSMWLLECGGTPVSTSAFNARLSDVVQIGGVFTPPPHRSRGYARAVVAGSLVAVAREGITRAILFTGEENVAARRAYEAIGFRRVGDYGLVLF